MNLTISTQKPKNRGGIERQTTEAVVVEHELRLKEITSFPEGSTSEAMVSTERMPPSPTSGASPGSPAMFSRSSVSPVRA
jgi:hypothetical protein